jgi:hypothetical protein
LEVSKTLGQSNFLLRFLQNLASTQYRIGEHPLKS